ncbi:MAG: YraN family protein [Muribaculaceae bacterium]|nr:YraN family protein [Muribaculaceae bacterium]MBR1476306.1 YraN family protein [Muribaculaceae bacterium]MBR1725205.1 YraN family protein [Muribaculaceae bacterium]
MAQHNALGQAGEQAARDFLIARGLTIREQNWRMNKLEIDIVAHDPEHNVLHIVEVKTRTSDEHYDPMKAITRSKKSHMVAAANAYLRYYQLKCVIVYDVMLVVGQPGAFSIRYIPRAFQPALRTYR